MTEHDKTELVHRYRPKLFKEVVGQETACQTLQRHLQAGTLPHALLFTGPSGTGKTTLARVVVNKLKVNAWNFKEINAAETRGIDTVREIIDSIKVSSLVPGPRAYIIDEAHKFTNEAQNAFLKPLEEPPKNVYFLLATTDATKLIPTVRGRCTEIKCGLVPHDKLVELVKVISTKENKLVTDEVADRIAEVADGGARAAVKILQTVLKFTTVGEQIDAIQKSETRRLAIDLCRALFGEGKRPPTWQPVAAILKDLDEDADGVRRMVMGYFAAIMVKSPVLAARCATVMNFFRDPFYDNAGKSVLVLACYEAVQALS
jgi:DNA polymerase III gamma/tau subunit